MNEPYKQKLNKEGYQTISKEEIDKLSGDYLFYLNQRKQILILKNTNAWKNIDAVKIIRYLNIERKTIGSLTLSH